MQSWERAKPLSRHDVFLNDRRQISGWQYDVEATYWDLLSCKNIPFRLFFIDPVYLCVVGRFACQVPILYPNSDGNTGAFFRAENYRMEFCAPKTRGLNAEVFALRVIFFGDLPSEAESMMNIMMCAATWHIHSTRRSF